MRMRVCGIAGGGQALAQALDDGGKGVLLDEVEQLFFGFEVIIKTGQGDAAQARQVAHGGAIVALVGKDLGGIIQDLSQTAVEACIVRRRMFQGLELWREWT